jgi:hypothetical protein|tara:strand:- start:163 stop:555 length:393 start_codon:yes stop_codon:yes gene_type:complete
LYNYKEKIMPITIHNKPYVMVHERVQTFNNVYPLGAIHTKLLHSEDGHYFVEAKVYPDTMETPDRYFTGLAHEEQGSTQINNTSALENAETSAIGRALGFLGLGTEDSIASAEEVLTAVAQQQEMKTQRR